MRFVLQAIALYTSLILLILAEGCAKSNQEQVEPGVTTASTLRSILGDPAHIWIPAVSPQERLFDYSDGHSFQVERDIVVGVSYPPSGGEETLQFWRHKWVGHTQVFEELPGTVNIHGQRRYQFASKQAGMAVIYDEASESVLRIVRYEKR